MRLPKPQPKSQQFISMCIVSAMFAVYAYANGDARAVWAGFVVFNVWLCGWAVVEALAPDEASAAEDGEDEGNKEDDEILAMLGRQ